MEDVTIIGGGIVGLATAYKLRIRYPGIEVKVLEKEPGIAAHQTGNNSGVIHSGLYYVPGSHKARNCVNGYRQLIEFCDRNEVKYELCGKIVVATDESELAYLQTLRERGEQNGLRGILELRQEELREHEPHVSGIAGLYVPQTGIIDYKEVSEAYRRNFEQMGGKFMGGEKVIGISRDGRSNVIETVRSTHHTKHVINCGGLYSDQLTSMTTGNEDVRIIPFRGEYYQLRPEKEYLVKNLIYPVPNPNFPFLGVHFTRMIHGGIEAGPNAVLAFKKEGYKRTDIYLPELLESIFWPGFIQVARKYWKTGIGEMHRSYFKSAFARALQKLIPEIKADDLVHGGSGVRAQACDRKGGLLDDFRILQDDHVINVCNAPSPAATSSLAIADEIVARVSAWENMEN